MHNETSSVLTKLGVNILLGSRIDLSSVAVHEEVNPLTNQTETIRTVKTLDGRRVKAELILFCTGQTPNTKFLKDLLPNTVDDRTGMAKINRSMQLAWAVEPEEEEEDEESKTSSTNGASIRLGGGGSKKKKKTLWKVEGDHDWPHALASPNEYTPFPPPPESCVSPAKRNAALPNISSTSTSTHSNSTTINSVSSKPETPKPTYGEALPITPEPKVALPNIFVIGDAADAFGALKAGHTAWTQAEVAARNICRIIASRPSRNSSTTSFSKSYSINSSRNTTSTSIQTKQDEFASNPNLPHVPFTPCSHDCACMETLDEEASKGVAPSKSSISKVANSERENGNEDVKDEEEDEFESWRKKIEATIGKDRLEKYHPPPPSIKVSLGLVSFPSCLSSSRVQIPIISRH